MKKRVTIISVERERVIEIRRPRRTYEGWCEQCRIHTHLLKPEELAAIAGLSSSQVFGLLETGRLHPVRTTEGLLFVCLNSLQPNDREIEDEHSAIVE